MRLLQTLESSQSQGTVGLQDGKDKARINSGVPQSSHLTFSWKLLKSLLTCQLIYMLPARDLGPSPHRTGLLPGSLKGDAACHVGRPA